MSPPIVYVDRSEVLRGNVAELERAVLDLVSHVAAQDLRLLSYDAYLSQDRSRMTVMHVTPTASRWRVS